MMIREFPCLYKKDTGFVKDEYSSQNAGFFQHPGYGYISERYYAPEYLYKNGRMNTGVIFEKPYVLPVDYIPERETPTHYYGWLPVNLATEEFSFKIAYDKLDPSRFEENQYFSLIGPWVSNFYDIAKNKEPQLLHQTNQLNHIYLDERSFRYYKQYFHEITSQVSHRRLTYGLLFYSDRYNEIFQLLKTDFKPEGLQYPRPFDEEQQEIVKIITKHRGL